MLSKGLENSNKIKSIISNMSTLGGVVLVGIGMFVPEASTIGKSILDDLGSGFTISGGVTLMNNGMNNINNYQKSLSEALYNGCANVIYMHANEETADFRGSSSEWSHWNEKHYVNKYQYLIDVSPLTIYIGDVSPKRFEVQSESTIKYGGIVDVSKYFE